MTNKPSAKSKDVQFRLKPLAACVRYALAGGLLVGNGAALAELPIPAAAWVSSGNVQAPVVDGNTMVIKQMSDKAILNWQKFNVGKENTVKFEQPGTSSIALNKINDQDPSRIMGQIVANGQIYLYNKNGFIFDKDSVVNANSFIATTLKITDEAWARGITRVYDESKGAALVIEPKTADDKLDPKTAEILINAGAKITTDKAGRIIIAAPKITNEGTVTAGVQGQIIMAASEDKVYLQAADDTSPFAGLLVEVGTGGKVTNTGDIAVRQGNVTLAGFAVNQEGRVSATTSVNVNGSIRLIAREKIQEGNNALLGVSTTRDAVSDTGLEPEAKVKLGNGSVTEVVADADGGSAIDEQKQSASYIEIGAHTVALESGSTIHAPGATVKVIATDTPASPGTGVSGRIHIDSGARIDVSGYKNVQVAMERNVGEISVQSYELRDSPLQRTGILKGQTVYVDLRKGSDIIDASGAEARISRGVQERLGTGGSIQLTSSGDVIANDGSRFDISGGSVQYQGGYIKTTKLVTDYGKIVDISDADPNERYASLFGVVTEKHAKWGVSKSWNVVGAFGNGAYESGYTEGKDAGSLSISAPKLAWGGTLAAGTVNGAYQRSADKVPSNGEFKIDLASYQSLQNIRFVENALQVALALNAQFPTQNADKPIDLEIDADLLKNTGIGSVTVKTQGDATLATDLSMQAGGSLTVQAGKIAVDAGFKAAGGTLKLQTEVGNADADADIATLGRIDIASGAVLDVSGRWVNDIMAGQAATPRDRLLIDGGTVELKAVGDIDIQSGARILADGGAWLPVNGDLKAGSGGSITLAAEGRSGASSTLTLAGEVSAYGLEQNGVLNLVSGNIIVGTPAATDDVSESLVLGTGPGFFDFSERLAFREINLNANSLGLTVKRDADLNLRQRNLQLTAGYQSAATDRSIRGFSKIVELPDNLRGSVKLGLTGKTGVTLETGSRIVTDTGSSIGLTSTAGSVFVDGTLQAAAGNINLAIVPIDGLQYDPTQMIWLGNHASLLAKGAVVLEPSDALGNRGGQVLDGGTLNFDARRGAVVISSGALLDVSGTKAAIDIQRSGNIAAAVVRSVIASNAGKISITAADGFVIDGEMRAYAGDDNAHGGRLTLALDRSRLNQPNPPDVPFPAGPLVINIAQSNRRETESNLKFGEAYPETDIGIGEIAADQIMAGGITDLVVSVNGSMNDASVVFVGDVNLTVAEQIRIDSAKYVSVGSVDDSAGSVVLNTAYLALGSDSRRDIAESADLGAGEFSGNAKWIQLNGASVWNGFQRVTLNSEHDIRAVGVREASAEQRDYIGALVTAGDIYLNATQIYPSTLSNFTFAVRGNPDGNIVISGSNSEATPLSAAGSLTFEASTIAQHGVVKAPFGSITFKATNRLTLADGSLTSVSGIDRLTATELLIPFGIVQEGSDWLYPLDSINNLVWDAPPEKRVVLNAPDIAISQGSVVDLAGGGDLLSYEFIPGSGGSSDYLLPGSDSYQGGFAILPKLASQLAPYDHYESGSWSYPVGTTVYLQGVGNLPAGEYTILPARYALLDGAYLITPVAGSQDQSITQYTLDGRSIVSGYFAQAGSDRRDARTSGFLVETGVDVRQRSEYQTHTANEFYPAQAKANETELPKLAMDGGQISLIAQTRLIMEGQFMMQALQGGRGAQMDIAANKIQVVASQAGAGEDSDTLNILASDLNNLNVESLLLGGARTRDSKSGETSVSVTSDSVVFGEGASLSGGEILAAANSLIEVKDGVSLNADRKVTSADSVLNVAGNGALLRVSGAGQVELNRTETDGSVGDLDVAETAVFHAAASMLLDASHSNRLRGELRMDGGSLNLAANSVNLGNVDETAADALNLSNAKLAQINVDELVLTARDSLGVYGNVELSGDRVTINAAGLTGHGLAGDSARIAANTLIFNNGAKAENRQNVDGQGRLLVSADRVEIGDGKFSLQGFESVDIAANDQFRATGTSDLRIAADFSLAAAGLGADAGASLTLDASGYKAEFIDVAGSKAIESGHGGTLAVTADSIDFDSRAELRSGGLSLHALSGNLNLGEHARIDLAGRAVKFGDVEQYTQGGRFSALADLGGIVAAAGSLIDVDTGGGDAEGGSVQFQALEKSALLQGELQAKSGSAAIEVGDFAAGQGFDALTQKLNGADIDRSIYIRVGQADIVQSQSGSVSAEQVTLVADTGSIELAGTVNADAADAGGGIKLYAGDEVVLADGAKLSARGTGDGAKGGSVLLSSVDSDGDGISGVAVGAGSSIDVHGNGAEGGDVTLRALRDGNGVRIQPVAGTVSGYKTFYAEGVAKYANADLGDDGRIDAADIAKIKADTAAYMTEANMAAVADQLGHGIRLLAGVEIDYSGDLTLRDNWDLVDWRYDENSDDNVWDDVPGRLVIRVDGELLFKGSLTDGFRDHVKIYEYVVDQETGATNAVYVDDKLQSGYSWSYQLSAGANLESADTNKTQAIKNLTVDSNVKIRTGTGDIQLNSGGDIVIAAGGSESVNLAVKASAGSDTLILRVNAGDWKVGGYLSTSASGVLVGAKIESITESVTHTTSAAAILRSLSIRLDNADAAGWKVGDYVSGTGVSSETVITKINPTGVDVKTTANAVKNATTVKVANVGGWAVGDYLTGTGVASGTVITAINTGTKTVTLSKALTSTISNGSTLSTLPSVHLSKALTRAVAENASFSTLPVAKLSQALEKTINANVSIKVTYTPGSVYSAGTTSSVNPYGTLSESTVGLNFYSEYPVNGGDLTLVAAGNIQGTVSGNDYNDWLLRRGDWSKTQQSTPTAWGVALGYIVKDPGSAQVAQSTKALFQQNIGSFGGGAVTVRAGGNVRDLEVVMPTTGKQIGNSDGTTNQVEVNGGGRLSVLAGGDILGGSYYVGEGEASLVAGGEVAGGSAYENGPVLLLGDTRFTVSSNGNVSLSGVTDPMIGHKGDVNFFSYSAESALNIASLFGDVSLYRIQPRIFTPTATSAQETLVGIYPASLNVTAFSGSINAKSEMTLFPSAKAELNFFADQDIKAEDALNGYGFGMSDADVGLLPSFDDLRAKNDMAILAGSLSPSGASESRFATVPVHSGDSEPVRLVTLQGNIENIRFILAKKALVVAGEDISNLDLAVQHITASDVTLIESGRDVVYSTERNLDGSLNSNNAGIEVNGPGELLVKAGRNVDLGASRGIETEGDVVNPNLPDQGANLSVLAGANGELDYAGFIKAYMMGDDAQALKARELITAYIRELSGDASLGEADALEAFAKLNSRDFVAIQPKLNAALLPVFFELIREAGSASASDKLAGNEGAYTAIETLFPGSNWQGDLKMVYSKIHTVDGGNINLMVPGGSVDVGLSIAATKDPSELGIVVQRTGAINAFVRDDFNVNTSRVFALDGGDIMLWSSKGDIDAGRGAKSAISAPAPKISFDEKGNMIIEFPPILNGSGIRTAGSSEGVIGGDVYLFAPQGVVDAGEAGIGGTNVTISATAVLGAQNIQVSGISTGVPVASVGSVAAGLTGTSNLTAGVSQMAESTVGGDVAGKNTAAAIAKAILGILSVEILGFGD